MKLSFFTYLRCLFSSVIIKYIEMADLNESQVLGDYLSGIDETISSLKEVHELLSSGGMNT